MLLILIEPSHALIGYTIDAQVGGTGYHISRSTFNMTFTNDGNITGTGNFSRFSQISRESGIESNERSSAVRGGRLSLEEKERLLTVEGPVVIQVSLASRTENVTVPDPDNPSDVIEVPKITESADIDIEETWLSYYAKYKKVSYEGKSIRNKEVYENNGDVVLSSIDSWDLDKESLYTTYINKTFIKANITPAQVLENRAMNRSSFYALKMDSTGSLTHLGIARGRVLQNVQQKGTQRDPDVLMSQDYVGHHSISMKLRLDDLIRRVRTDDEWLSCCAAGYSDLKIREREGLSADRIFSCYNCTI